MGGETPKLCAYGGDDGDHKDNVIGFLTTISGLFLRRKKRAGVSSARASAASSEAFKCNPTRRREIFTRFQTQTVKSTRRDYTDEPLCVLA